MGRWYITSFEDKERIGETAGHWGFGNEFGDFDDLTEVPSDTRALRIGRYAQNIRELSRLSKLEEVYLIHPTPDQVQAVFQQKQIKRLLFGDAHKLHLAGIENLTSLEELAFLNSSGPADLGILAELPNLRSLMLENLRGLTDWASIGRLKKLRCYCLTGGFVEATTHIPSLAYLKDLAALEHLYVAGVSYSGTEPAFEGLRHCKNLKTAVIVPGCFSLEDNAYLEAHLPEAVRYFKTLYEVNGKDNFVATTLQDAETLPAHKDLDASEDRLSWVPLVKAQKGRSFTRIYTGLRSRVLTRLKEFEACYSNALEAAKKDSPDDHNTTP